MIIQDRDGLIVIYSEGTNKITNKNRSFFTNMVYLGKNDSVDNYEEVPRDIWKHYIEDKLSDFDELDEKIYLSNLAIYELEDISLYTDYRLMCVEMYIDFGQGINAVPMLLSLSSESNSKNVKGGDSVYSLLKKRIERQTYANKEEMQTMLDLYFFNDRITADQYEELSKLLAEQDKE